MNAKRLSMALIIALAVSGLFTFWLSKRVARANHSAASRKQMYVATAKTLDAGELLKPGNLKLVEWPTSTPLAGGFAKVNDVAGRVVLYPLAEGEPILDRHLAAAGAGVGLTANIPEGMRAISVKSDEVVGVAGFLLPGTHVDVLVTYRAEKTQEQRTATVLQDVGILAVGQQTHPDPEGKPASVNVVTLLLKPEETEKVVLATSLGSIHFVLRNGSDRAQTTNPSIGLDQLAMGIVPAPSSDTGAARPRQVLQKPKQYQVETILGNKQIINSF